MYRNKNLKGISVQIYFFFTPFDHPQTRSKKQDGLRLRIQVRPLRVVKELDGQPSTYQIMLATIILNSYLTKW